MSEPADGWTLSEARTPLLRVTVYGVPAPGGSKSLGVTRGGRHFVRESSRRAAPWRDELRRSVGPYMEGRGLLDGALGLSVNFYLPRPKAHYGARGLRPSAPPYPIVRPDTTKLLRPLEDALTGLVWRDDAQVVIQLARRWYGEPARCVLHVWRLPEPGADGLDDAASTS